MGFLSTFSSECSGPSIAFPKRRMQRQCKHFLPTACEFSGARTAKLATGSNSFTNPTRAPLGAAQKFYQPKIPDTFPAALVFESNLLPKAVLVFCWIVLGVIFGFVLGRYFVIMQSQNGASDPEEAEKGSEVRTDKLCLRAAAGEGRMCYASRGASYIRMESCNANINKVNRAAKENSLLFISQPFQF